MGKQPPISVETRLKSDGVLTLTGLPFRAGDHLIVQIEASPANGVRRFPMRGRQYQFKEPFEAATAPGDWEALR